MDDAVHKEYTGVSNQLIIDNLIRLSALTKKIIIRIPIIPHVNDDKKNIEQTADFILKLPHIQEIHLLPYHRLGVTNYSRLMNANFVIDDFAPFEDKTDEIKKHFEALGFTVKSGG